MQLISSITTYGRLNYLNNIDYWFSDWTPQNNQLSDKLSKSTKFQSSNNIMRNPKSNYSNLSIKRCICLSVKRTELSPLLFKFFSSGDRRLEGPATVNLLTG